MPRKKIQPKPIRTIPGEKIDVEEMEDGWDITGHGSNNAKKKNTRLNEALMRVVDDFVDENHNLKPIIKGKNDYFENATSFARQLELYGIGYDLSSDQQLRKKYYDEIKSIIEGAIKAKIIYAPPPKNYLLKKILDLFKTSK
jgi:hypothetical protein